uniref:Gustatory receptor n=1 Tax=Cacopsylla melanoneura TaxID=428564 RepID=A0A8D8VPJ6_9HEMI
MKILFLYYHHWYFFVHRKTFLIHDYLEILRECHKKLSDLLILLNYIYQIHLLLALSACFLKLLFNIYFAMFGYVVGTAVPHSDKEATELFRTVLWSMYYAMRFLCVVMSVEVTAKQAKRTNIIVANVNSRHLDSKTKEELSLFSGYVTSRELKYTAAGFFSLNSHLITSVSCGTRYYSHLSKEYLHIG